MIRAYKTASYEAILQAKIITKNVKEQYEVKFKYPQINDVMRIIKEYKLEVINTNLKMECKLIFAVKKNKSETILNAFMEKYKLTIRHLKTT